MKSGIHRFLSLTLREWGLIILGVGAALTLWIVFPDKWIKLYIVTFAIGFLYEASMDALFTYHPEIRERHCIGNTDINFLLPFGWVHIVGASALVAERGLGFSSPFSYMAATFLVGSCSEIVFYKLNYWVYHYDHAYIGKFKPFLPKVTLLGIPVQVYLGYAVNGLPVYLIVRKLL